MNEIEVVTLDNGLTIYLYQDQKKHSTLFQFVTLFGGVTKDFIMDGVTYHLPDGIAHILEHYLVEYNSVGNFLKMLGEKQMHTNASTHFNMTEFYFETVSNLEYGIQTLLEGIYSPIFSQQNLFKVKEPIYQEIRGRSDNKFYQSNIETFNQLFSKFSFRSIGGSLQEVKKTTLSELELCYKAFYQPQNQFIVVGGNFNKQAVLQQIMDFYQKKALVSHSVKVLSVLEPLKVHKKVGKIHFPTAQEYTQISYKIPIKDFSVKERLKLDFYISFFCHMFFGLSSVLYQELVQQKIIIGDLSYHTIILDNFLILSIGSYTECGDTLVHKIRNEISSLEHFDVESFELDKCQSILNIILRPENLEQMLLPFVENIANFHYPYPDTKEDIEAFSFDDFREMISSLNFNHFTIITIKNEVSKRA